MNFALVLIPMWVLTTALIVTIIDARPEPTISTTSGHIMLVEEQPITQFSAKMEAQSPGISKSRVLLFQLLSQFSNHSILYLNYGYFMGQWVCISSKFWH